MAVPISFVTTVSPPYCCTLAASMRASSLGIGIGVLLVSVFSGWAGYWIAGLTTARMKSTSETRSAAASATRRPTKAPSSTEIRRCSGIASWSAQTCSVVAT